MTNISISGSEEHFTGKYADPDPSFSTYYAYRCCYCEKFFYLVDPKTFEAMGAIKTIQYRDKNTGEIKARENRSEGVCSFCVKEIMRRQSLFTMNHCKNGSVSTLHNEEEE
jgi:hypothetical protein